MTRPTLALQEQEGRWRTQWLGTVKLDLPHRRKDLWCAGRQVRPRVTTHPSGRLFVELQTLVLLLLQYYGERPLRKVVRADRAVEADMVPRVDKAVSLDRAVRVDSYCVVQPLNPALVASAAQAAQVSSCVALEDSKEESCSGLDHRAVRPAEQAQEDEANHEDPKARKQTEDGVEQQEKERTTSMTLQPLSSRWMNTLRNMLTAHQTQPSLYHIILPI